MFHRRLYIIFVLLEAYSILFAHSNDHITPAGSARGTKMISNGVMRNNMQQSVAYISS